MTIIFASLVYGCRVHCITTINHLANPNPRQPIPILTPACHKRHHPGGYVFNHPAALSDLILVLRDRRPPGAEHGRPLRQPAEGLWELPDDYLATAPPPINRSQPAPHTE